MKKFLLIACALLLPATSFAQEAAKPANVDKAVWEDARRIKAEADGKRASMAYRWAVRAPSIEARPPPASQAPGWGAPPSSAGWCRWWRLPMRRVCVVQV